jgi:hypothetical protein
MLATAALAALAILAVPGAAFADCGVPPTLEDGLQNARVVFVGEVVGLDDADRTATFDVQWVWKGDGVEEQVVVSGAGDVAGGIGPEDRVFQTGITYLVATPSATQPYLADRCTATRPFQGAGAAIPPTYQEAVGTSTAWSPDPVATADDGTGSATAGAVVPIILGGIVLVAMFLTISRFTRGPAAAPSGPTKRDATRSKRSGRAPSVGRTGERFSGAFRRSGVDQTTKLRGIRRKKERRPTKRRTKSPV